MTLVSWCQFHNDTCIVVSLLLSQNRSLSHNVGAYVMLSEPVPMSVSSYWCLCQDGHACVRDVDTSVQPRHGSLRCFVYLVHLFMSHLFVLSGSYTSPSPCSQSVCCIPLVAQWHNSYSFRGFSYVSNHGQIHSLYIAPVHSAVCRNTCYRQWWIFVYEFCVH